MLAGEHPLGHAQDEHTQKVWLKCLNDVLEGRTVEPAMTNPHKQVLRAWLSRVHDWLRSERGNTQRLARHLNIDRRRLSQWFARPAPSVPGWAVAPLARLTGQPLHMDHLPVLPAVTPESETTLKRTKAHDRNNNHAR